MKTTRFFVSLISAGVLLAASALPAFAQALRTDSAGNLREDSALNLAGPRIMGILPTVHLGTGTPTTGTVLRGDGSWAGTTPTGNTIASTGNLLMGDGAGNAAAVASSPELGRVLTTRLETQRASEALPDNLLKLSPMNVGSINADGTITLPANGYAAWDVVNTYGSSPPFPLYGYAVSVGDAPSGAVTFRAFYGADRDSEAVDSTRAPGVYRTQFLYVTYGVYAFSIRVENKTAAPLTIYYPFVGLVDGGLSFLRSGADSTVVPSQPVADLDFTRFAATDRAGRYLAERQTTIAADSINGSADNAGTLYAPRLSLQQTVTAGSVFGLYRGSVFRDSLPLSTLSNTHGVVVQDVALGSQKPLPVISALDPAVRTIGNPFDVEANGSTYAWVWLPESAVANDGYQNVYVVEINVATEAASPVASRRRMIDAASLAAAVATPGSAFVEKVGPGAGAWTAHVHPSDGLAPGSGGYRYEVVARFCPLRYPQNDTGDCAVSGLELIGGSYGYGSLGAPTGLVGDRLAILHGSTHGAVLGGGSLQRSVFYEGGDADSIMLAWYTGDPAGLSWSMNNVLFYGNVGDRSRDMLIAHSGGGTSYERGDISDCAFLGARWSDGSLHGTAFTYENVLGGTINRVYVQAVRSIFGGAMPLATETRNSVFRQVNRGALYGNFHDNVVLAESGLDPADANNRSPVACQPMLSGTSVTNNILWAHGLSAANNGSASGVLLYVAQATVRGNIILLDPAATYTDGVSYAYVPGDLSGISVDYNLVISTAKGSVNTLGGSAGNQPSFPAYQAAYPTMDPHSKFVDLSGDARGLQAVFVDPLNGDFRWAQTAVARECAAYCRANHVGPATVPSRWPLVPSADDAVRSLTDL